MVIFGVLIGLAVIVLGLVSGWQHQKRRMYGR